jgi:hypothetical protein
MYLNQISKSNFRIKTANRKYVYNQNTNSNRVEESPLKKKRQTLETQIFS